MPKEQSPGLEKQHHGPTELLALKIEETEEVPRAVVNMHSRHPRVVPRKPKACSHPCRSYYLGT